MKLISNILTLLFVVAFFATASAQVKGSGVQYFTTVSQMNAYTPTLADGSEKAVVRSASLAPANYNYNFVTSTWVAVADGDGDSTNEIQTAAQVNVTAGSFSGQNVQAALDNIQVGLDADNDQSATNEIQTAAQVAVTATANYTGANVQLALNNIAANQHSSATLGAGNGTSFTLSGQAFKLDEAVLANNLAIPALKTLSGVASGATNLGTFTGNVIPANATIKSALQSLASANVNAISASKTQYYDDAAASSGGVTEGAFYELALSNRYGGIRGTIRRRQ